MIRSKSDIIDFFNEYIFGFIINDINRCIEAKTNYVVALSLLSYTEYIGGLITGKLGVDSQSSKNFNKVLEHFQFREDRNYYKDFKVQYIDENGEVNNKADIYKIFRCGLIHEYFIKGDSFVHNETSYLPKEDKGVDWIDGRLRFHCNAYFRDFKKAVDSYYKLLIVDQDPNLLKNFNEALDRIQNRKVKKQL